MRHRWHLPSLKFEYTPLRAGAVNALTGSAGLSLYLFGDAVRDLLAARLHGRLGRYGAARK